MARNPERRRKPRREQGAPNGLEIDVATQPGRSKRIVAKLTDLNDFGCAADTTSPLEVAIPVVLRSRFFSAGLTEHQQRCARVIHCRLLDDNVYRVGFAFDEPALNGDSSHRRDPTVDSSLVDYYEALQLSPNADFEAIQRSYRMLAQRYHPDNADTGNEAAFRLVLEAYRVIS